MTENNQELKTLTPEDNYETARAKAIKWVKYWKTMIKEFGEVKIKDDYEIENYWSNQMNYMSMKEGVDLFMHFFNLTEEDLK